MRRRSQQPAPAAQGHPAFGQYGLFASCKIAPNEHVLDYCGLVHTEKESDPGSDYDIRFIACVSAHSAAHPQPLSVASLILALTSLSPTSLPPRSLLPHPTPHWSWAPAL